MRDGPFGAAGYRVNQTLSISAPRGPPLAILRPIKGGGANVAQGHSWPIPGGGGHPDRRLYGSGRQFEPARGRSERSDLLVLIGPAARCADALDLTQVSRQTWPSGRGDT